jgi:hypothetical protein
MRKTLTVASLTALILLLGATLLFAHHGPAEVTIAAAQAKQPAVVLDHAKHAKTLVKTCDTCHHTNKGLTDETDAQVQKCSACHLDPKGAVPGMREMSMTKNPFHSLCVGCHKTEKKGPTVCKDCHKK